MGSDAQREMDLRVLAMREAGASWLDIQREFNVTRQQARYAYQRASREKRRNERKQAKDETGPDS